MHSRDITTHSIYADTAQLHAIQSDEFQEETQTKQRTRKRRGKETNTHAHTHSTQNEIFYNKIN